MNVGLWFLASALFSFSGTVLLGKILIPVLTSHKMGQKILAVGPRWHMKKEGTPTMGGICFLPPIVLAGLAGCLFLLPRAPRQSVVFLLLTVLYALMNGVVGIVDDLAKFRHKRNDGLTPRQKLVLQSVSAAAYLSLLAIFGFRPDLSRLPLPAPFRTEFVFYLFSAFLLVGVVNCANLTDGIDGLAASDAAVLAGFFGLVGAGLLSEPLSLLSGAVFGGAAGFLLFNYHPARAFMGDTGSLFLGASLAGCSFLSGDPLLIFFAGFLYVLEGLSVVLQVLFFKITGGRRLFRMAPIHHHFESLGWSEPKIVAVFSFFSILTSALAYLFLL